MFREGRLESIWMRKIKRRYYRLGAAQSAVGVLWLVVPLFITVSDRFFVGSAFFVLGTLVGWNAFAGFREGDKPWHQTMIAVTTWIAGLVFLFHPLSEVIMISFFVSTYFFVDGVMRLLEFLRVRTLKGSLWMLFAGLLEIIFGFVSWGESFNDMPAIRLMLTIYLTVSGMFVVMAGRD